MNSKFENRSNFFYWLIYRLIQKRAKTYGRPCTRPNQPWSVHCATKGCIFSCSEPQWPSDTEFLSLPWDPSDFTLIFPAPYVFEKKVSCTNLCIIFSGTCNFIWIFEEVKIRQARNSKRKKGDKSKEYIRLGQHIANSDSDMV